MRLRWVVDAIALTRRFIEAETAESQVELMMSRPESWDYDYNTDIIRICKQAQKTIEALEADRDLILNCQRHIRRDIEEGKFDDD